MKGKGVSPWRKGANRTILHRELCAGRREAAREALVAGYVGRVWSTEIGIIRDAEAITQVEGNIYCCDLVSGSRVPRCLRPQARVHVRHWELGGLCTAPDSRGRKGKAGWPKPEMNGAK